MANELERFKLPDGTVVATGNIAPDVLPLKVSTFPEALLLENDDIKRRVECRHYMKQRKHFAKWMINQGSIGKCNTSATCGGAYHIRDLHGHSHIPLADNHLYWRINGGRDIGSMLHEGMAEVEARGVCPRTIEVDGQEVTIPHNTYNANQLPRNVVDAADREGLRFKSWEPVPLPQEYGLFKRALASVVARGWPVIHAWHVGSNSMRLRNGYVQQGRGGGNHATLFHAAKWVGGQDLIHPDSKNSWGPTQSETYGRMGIGWGDGGYGLFTMEDAFYCRRNHVFWAFTGVILDPEDDLA